MGVVKKYACTWPQMGVFSNCACALPRNGRVFTLAKSLEINTRNQKLRPDLEVSYAKTARVGPIASECALPPSEGSTDVLLIKGNSLEGIT